MEGDEQEFSSWGTIFGVTADPRYNGHIVELMSWDGVNGRWIARMSDGTELAVGPQNIARTEKKDLEKASRASLNMINASKSKARRKKTAEPVLHLLQSIEAQFDGVDWQIDFLVDQLTPLITEITGELLDRQPDDALVHAAVWLSEKAGAPEKLANDLKQWQKDVSTPGRTEQEIEAEEFVEREKRNRQCTFTFLDADWVRNADLTHLPSYQDLQEMEGALHELTLNIDDAYRGKYREILTVSHRWEEPEDPDADGEQLEAIKAFLKSEGQKTKLMWYDFSSLPQGKRTRDQLIRVRWMMQNANILYLGTEVLILLDVGYLSRFWTQFEAWLSMQKATSKGLAAASPEQCRCIIKCIHHASDHEKNMLQTMWAAKRPLEVKQILSAPNVTLTCAGDRFVQFQKIDILDSEVQRALAYEDAVSMAAMGSDASQLKGAGFSASQLRDAGFSLSQLRDAGFEASELSKARRVSWL